MSTSNIALCISGQMRTYEKCFPSIKKYLLEPYQPDIFIHTWTDRGSANQPKRFLPSSLLNTAKTNKNLNRFLNNFISNYSTTSINDNGSLIDLDHIQSLYNPKDLVLETFPENGHWRLFGNSVPDRLIQRIEELNIGLDSNFLAWRGVLGGLPMFYKIYACNDIIKKWQIKNNVTYDLVIRLRPDIVLTDTIPLIDTSTTNCIGFSTTKEPSNYSTGHRVSDQFFWGPPDLMDNIANIWSKLPEYYSTMADSPEYNVFGGERVLALHCRRENIQLKPYRLHEQILREKRNYKNILNVLIKSLRRS